MPLTAPDHCRFSFSRLCVPDSSIRNIQRRMLIPVSTELWAISPPISILHQVTGPAAHLGSLQ